MRASARRRIRQPWHEREAVGGKGVVQLAGHHGRPADGVGRVAGPELLVSEDDGAAANSLEGQNQS